MKETTLNDTFARAMLSQDFGLIIGRLSMVISSSLMAFTTRQQQRERANEQVEARTEAARAKLDKERQWADKMLESVRSKAKDGYAMVASLKLPAVALSESTISAPLRGGLEGANRKAMDGLSSLRDDLRDLERAEERRGNRITAAIVTLALMGAFATLLLLRINQNREEAAIAARIAATTAAEPTATVAAEMTVVAQATGTAIDWETEVLTAPPGILITTFNTNDGSPVASVDTASDPEIIVSGTVDGAIRVWRTIDGKRIASIDNGGRISDMVVSPDAEMVATGDHFGVVRLWRAADGKSLATLSELSGSVQSLAFTPDGRLISGEDGGSIRLWEPEDGSLPITIGAHSAPVLSVAVSPDGQIVASGGADRIIRLWQISDGQLLGSTEGESGITSLAFSPDGHYLVSSWGEQSARVWQVTGLRPLEMLSGHDAFVTDIAYSPDGQFIATASRDNTARLWRAADGTLLGVLSGHTEPVNSVAFSIDGLLVITGSSDGSVRLWRSYADHSVEEDD